MKTLYDKRMYCEYEPTHFKMYCPCEEEKLFINVYAETKDNKITIIFEALRKKYEWQWMSPYQAALRAKAVVKDFFTTCKELSAINKFPFRVRISVLDLTKYKNGRKLWLHGRDSGQDTLQSGDKDVPGKSKNKKLLRTGLQTPKARPTKNDSKRLQNRGVRNG